MGSGFQWLVALRYLKLEVPRSARVHRVALVVLVLLGVAQAMYMLLDRGRTPLWADLRADYAGLVFRARLVLILVLVLVEVFVLLVRQLTIFTTIATYGLFLGSGALVIVLSVMSGFEADLKHKILGANAHIVVQTPDHPFTDYVAVQDKLKTLPELVGVSPFISNEVMISSSSNL